MAGPEANDERRQDGPTATRLRDARGPPIDTTCTRDLLPAQTALGHTVSLHDDGSSLPIALEDPDL